MRNKEFESNLERANNALKDLSKASNRACELEEIHRLNAEKLLQYQQDLKKSQLYNDTIKKQEIVISKLEKIMEKIVEDNHIA